MYSSHQAGCKPLSDSTLGRVVSVAGAKAIVMLDHGAAAANRAAGRPELGTLLAVETPRAVVLAIVAALSIPVPSQREGEHEFWIAELALVGELTLGQAGSLRFARGTTSYPALGDRVRVASHAELQTAFSDAERESVRIGALRQDSSIAATINVDDLLGKHFAVLGTTGTGKSCTTALILRAIIEKNRAAHVVLLDAHNEYASAFGELAEVISPRDLQLPIWLLSFDEVVEVVLGDKTRKLETELLAELIPIARARFADAQQGGDEPGMRRLGDARLSCSINTPLPYRICDLLSLIHERMGRLEHKSDLPPYRHLKSRIELLYGDPRYSFLFGAPGVTDDMAAILGRVFRVPVLDKPLTIVELTGLPSEAVEVVVAILCRLTFEFALWSEGQVPVTLVCEEAHRYVPANAALGFPPCRQAIAKIAKEGRKYGASLCIVTQRPSEVDATILSQCNTVFALRMANDRDQAIVSSAIADTGLGLVEFLPALGQREAIAFGDGVALPVRLLFDELPRHAMPRSGTARFSERWQHGQIGTDLLNVVVDRWRALDAPRDFEVRDAGDGFQADLVADAAAVDSSLQDAAATLRAKARTMESAVAERDGALPASHHALRERLMTRRRS